MSEATHRSVMYEEVLDALQPHPGGYLAVDCTTNGGGHSLGLLERSAPDGRLVCLDADPDALERAAVTLSSYASRVQLVNDIFRYLASVAERLDVREVVGVIFDLGLSSLQLEASGRGFSLRLDEPLDMRFG